MKRNSYHFLSIFMLLLPLFALAQKGTISGKIIDAKTAEELIGCTVRLDAGAGGALTDYEGNFTIANVVPGTHQIAVSYTGYTEKVISDVIVKNGEATTVNIAMEDAAASLISEVVITATARRSSMSALTILQKNSPIIADGISAEVIKRTPDRTTGDVIRRVSGASIQDNKFAIIRGLNDRYNIALLNGALLSSTEPDRKAFSFDLFPSSMLDNLLVMKTASADLPGEFAGGAIILNTKDIPEQNYLQVNAGAGYNTVSTFKAYQSAQGGGTDFLGLDDGARGVPAGYPSSTEFQQSSKAEKLEYSRQFANDWAIMDKSSAAPNSNLQLAAGLVSAPDRKVQFGSTLAFSYSNNNRLQTGERNDFDTERQLFNFQDNQFKNNVLWGSLANVAMKINNRHKINLQGTYSTNTDNIISSREGSDFEQERYVRATAIEYTENHLLTTRLSGEHSFGLNNIKFNWGGGYNRTSRDVPSLRRMFYSKNFDAEAEDPYRAYVPYGSADPFRSGRFYSDLSENVYNGNVDLTIPFVLGAEKQSVKVGGLYQGKDRDFNARVMGYIRARVAGFDNSLLLLPQDQIFAPENIRDNGFIMDEITNLSDAYIANSDLSAAYILFDNTVFEKLRINWGLRVEHFNQHLESSDYSGNPLEVDNDLTTWLPSANLTYRLNDKHQLRLSGSKTVSRPEFREVAPFAFYDFYLNAGVVGSPELTPGEIYNVDLRYEIYPGQNELFSVSLFYKKFNNPIEFTFSSLGAGTRTFNFQNIPSANNYGVELELRKHLGFIAAGLQDLTFFTNAAFIRSKLDLSNVSSFDSDRALQGQSPYLVNTGLTYNHANWGLSTTLVYNIIGDRVAYVGTTGYADVYERHRNLLDFQIAKRLGERGEVKLTWGDILRPDFMYYQDNNANHKFDADVDNVMQRLNFGSTITLGFGYRF
ncbi:MAG: TonB-dependent receptor [Lewinellaceae bacterium]|nr:TonB-dependent receptor [Lewinellaceae bacterium]